MITFSHSGNVGDIIYSLPTVISICKRKQQKAHFYLKTNTYATYYPNAVHPLGNIRLNKAYAEALIPLLEAQDYIDKAAIYNDEEINIDLDSFRNFNLDMARIHLPRRYFYVFHANYNLAEPWLKVEPNPDVKDYILVNRTKRYRNLAISYKFLSQYGPIFTGLEDEFEDFTKEVGRVSFFKAVNFLELAQIIAGCKLFIGNQSFAFSLAEALKVPRILEICSASPNVIPHGNRAWDFYTQGAFEAIVATELK
jgi:hypothetical protein